MKLKGAVFNFSGTLFWDEDKQKKSWNNIARELRGDCFTEEELEHIVYGNTNRIILEYLLERKIKEDELKELINRRESYYQNLCEADNANFHLASGATELLNWIKSNDIPVAIATLNNKDSFEFFWKNFNLETWFKKENVIYNMETVKGNFCENIYKIAAKSLNREPKECIAFEDTVLGVNVANAAQIGKVFAIVEKKDRSLKEIIKIAKKFKDADGFVGDFSQVRHEEFFEI